MSKSLGNVLDPFEVMDTYGTDALRYYCFREVSFGQDGAVSTAGFESRYETELANDYGNLASPHDRDDRPLPRRRGPGRARPTPRSRPTSRGLADEVVELLDRAEITQALERIWQRVRRLNRYVEEQAPWKLAKDPEQADAARHRPALARRGPARRDGAAAPVHARDDRAAAGRARPGRRLRDRGGALRRRTGRPRSPRWTRRCSRSSDPPAGPGESRSDRLPHPPRPRARDATRSWSPPRARRACGASSPSARTPPSCRAALAAAEAHEEVFAAVGRHPNDSDRLRRRRDRGAARARARTRAAARSGRPGSTTTATTRRARTRSARSRAHIGARARDRQAAGDPHARRRGRHDRDARPRGAGARGDPALLLDARPPRRVPRARLVDLLRGQRHLPEGRRISPRPPSASRSTACWSRPTRPTSRPQALRKHRNQPAYVVHTARFVAERRGIAYAELEAAVEANAARLFGW